MAQFHVTVTAVTETGTRVTETLRSWGTHRAQVVSNVRAIWPRCGMRIISISAVELPKQILQPVTHKAPEAA